MASFEISILANATIGTQSVVLEVDKTGVKIDLGKGAIPLIPEALKEKLPLKLPQLELSNFGVGYNTQQNNKGFYGKGRLTVAETYGIDFPLMIENSDDGKSIVQFDNDGESSLSKRINIEKSIGPVTLHALKVSAENFTPSFSIITSFKMAGLIFKLIDFGVDFTLAIPPKPKGVHLAGLELSYDKGAIEIGGAFLKEKDKQSYLGSALIKTKAFSITALGGLDLEKKDPSFFIYAVLNKALGGPPFFTVTGLAAGLGINRKLNVPPVADLEKFPLIAAATGGQSGGELLENLIEGKYLPNSSGNMWFAIGVKFTSFQLVESFALMTIAVGDQFAMHILGVSTARIGVGKGDSAVNYIYAKMLMKASFIPDEGFLGIEARLASGSYVLQKSCSLEGGFAFYQWFSGRHKDDFVLTWGGYHPKYTVPLHYPAPPRLAINWPISYALKVKGTAYMAITPAHLMAGGRLEAVWKKGKIRAWFNIEANFLIQWKPFQYEADFRVSIGASFRIKVLFVKVKVSISVHVGVRIWGPDFSGRAVVDLKIISFNIPFGKSKKGNKVIDWSEFRENVLPTEIILPSATNGLLSDLEAERESNGETALSRTEKIKWIVDPKEFQIDVKFAIPFKTCKKEKGDQTSSLSTVSQVELSIRLLGIDDAKVESGITYQLKREGTVVPLEGIEIIALKSEMPKALWGKPKDNGLNNENSLPLFDTLRVLAKKIGAGSSREFTLEDLMYHKKSNTNFEKPLYKTKGLTVLPVNRTYVNESDMKNINAAKRKKKRTKIITELNNLQGFGIKIIKPEEVDLTFIEKYEEGRFWNWPIQYDSSKT